MTQEIHHPTLAEEELVQTTSNDPEFLAALLKEIAEQEEEKERKD